MTPPIPENPSSAAAHSPRSLVWSAAICVLVAVCMWVGPYLLRADLYDGDATHHIWWFYRYMLPGAFPDDPSVAYFASSSVAPLGYRALYSMLAPLIDVLLAAKIISVLLLVASAWLAWQIGLRLAAAEHRGLTGLLTLAALLCLLPVIDMLPPTGVQRAFALPATLLCLLGLTARRYRWIGVSWIVAALFYPVVVPVLGLAAGAVLLLELVEEKRLPSNWLWNAVLGASAIAIVLAGSGVPDGVGPMVTIEQARQMQEFGPHGRQVLFGSGWDSYWFRHHRTGLGWSPWVLAAIAASVLLARSVRRGWPLPRAAWSMLVTGICLWFLARLFLFYLYLPNRHSRWTIAAFAIVALGAGGYALLHLVAGVLSRRGKPAWPMLSATTAIVAPLVVAVVLWPGTLRALQQPVDRDLDQVLAYIRQQPADFMIAAHPQRADPVPLRGRHSVLASSELSISFMLGYHEKYASRIETSLRATYAKSWDEFDRLLAPFGVDAMLVDDETWQLEGYFEPFDSLVQELRQDRNRPPVLRSPPAERVLFRSGDVYLVRVLPVTDAVALDRH